MGRIMPSSFGDMWDSIRIKHRVLREMGLCHLSFHKVPHGRALIVVCPDCLDFKQRAYALGGRYRKRTLCWHFPAENFAQVHQLCVSVFGQQAIRSDARDRT